MVIFSNAKINIGLNITEKRSDSFHNIESIFYPVDLKDILEIVKSDSGLQFKNTGIVVDSLPEDNLIIKAYNLIAKDYDIQSVKIHLHKTIPIGAGLGGGSSNSVFMLKLLNDFFELSISNEQLTSYARQLGSDCAFFVKNIPIFASEKGDIFSDIDLDLSDYKIVVKNPNIFVSTQEAYSGIVPQIAEISLKNLIKRPISEWKHTIKNDFEKEIFKKYPKIKELKDEFYNKGAIYASMSGSGSSVYGIFEKDKSIKN